MQSGILASSELQNAFKQFVSSPTERALFAGISKEQIVPLTTIPLQSSTFTNDLHLLQPHLSPNAAAYILLKVNPADSNGYAAITYVPNSAPVRQKTLFASTSLTLVRELGPERFPENARLFVTEAAELTAEGWAKHEAHERLAAPLTEEEAGLAGVKEAEAQESQGTSTRRGHVNSRVNVPTGEGVLEALQSLKEEGCRETLVQLKFQLPDETLTLHSSNDSVSPGEIAGLISATEPRYSFYSHPVSSTDGEPNILFLYTCPSTSKIKERMIYSTSKGWTRTVAERDAGIVVTRSLEATEPDELTADMLGTGNAQGDGPGGADQAREAETKASGFARPKRPGRR